MSGLFTDSSAWDKKITKKWAVSGGASAGLGAVFSAEVKVMNFHHLGLQKKKSLLLVSASVGAKMQASFKAVEEVAELGIKNTAVHFVESKGIDTAIKYWGDLKKLADSTGRTLPISFAPPSNLTVHNAFCLQDLCFANAIKASSSVEAGILKVGTSGITFFSRRGVRLFTMSGVELEATLGVGINIASIQGSRLLDIYPSALPEAEQAANRLERKRLRKKYPDTVGRRAGGLL